MKSQERHELETNALAKLLAEWGERLAPYSSHILFGIVALVAAVAIWRLSASAWSGGGSEGWDNIATTMVEPRPDLSSLKTTGEDFKGNPEGELARLLMADSDLYTAGYQFLAEKDDAVKRLASAKETYDELAKGAKDPIIRERAKLGLARAIEMDGNIEEAIAAYKEVGGIYKESAEARATMLAEGNAAKYGKWLRDAQGTIPRRPLGLGGPLDFSPDALPLPPETPPTTGPAFGDEPLKEFESLFQNMPEAPKEDRYEGTPGTDASEGQTATEGSEPAPSTEESTPPADAPAADTPAEPSGDEGASPDSTGEAAPQP
jgi:hypothetical protein